MDLKVNIIAESLEKESTVYKTLLESTKAIPWKMDWKSMRFSYIGPQIEDLLGWSLNSWKSLEDWAHRMHPDDNRVVDNCILHSKAGDDHEADYRVLAKNGKYVWIRDVVNVVRNSQGEIESLVGFMFDISERKKTEEKLITLQKELEDLSFKDSLTGIANRRMFDSILDMEWLNARRNSQPLSLIMIDIDYFKQYNDHYGHIQGDACLKRVSAALSNSASRARDTLARYGGEEFILILPETNAASANKIAQRCRNLIFKEQIAHAKSEVGQLLTVSIGVATIVPTHKDKSITFVNEVDNRLYQAKHKGRNAVVGS